MNGHSRYQHCNESGNITPSNESRKALSGQSSPISGGEDTRSNSSKCRKCRRSSQNTGDKVGEPNVHFSDKVSLQSFQADEIVSEIHTYDPAKPDQPRSSGRINIDSLSELSLSQESSDSVASHSQQNVTEVESDRPLYRLNDPLNITVSEAFLNRLEKGKSGSHRSLSKSRSEENCTLKRYTQSSRLRRRSCELTLENSCISTLDEFHCEADI